MLSHGFSPGENSGQIATSLNHCLSLEMEIMFLILVPEFVAMT